MDWGEGGEQGLSPASYKFSFIMDDETGGWGGRRWGKRGEESWEQVMGRSEAVMPPVYME
jgi:hypothetical protein